MARWSVTQCHVPGTTHAWPWPGASRVPDGGDLGPARCSSESPGPCQLMQRDRLELKFPLCIIVLSLSEEMGQPLRTTRQPSPTGGFSVVSPHLLSPPVHGGAVCDRTFACIPDSPNLKPLPTRQDQPQTPSVPRSGTKTVQFLYAHGAKCTHRSPSQ